MHNAQNSTAAQVFSHPINTCGTFPQSKLFGLEAGHLSPIISTLTINGSITLVPDTSSLFTLGQNYINLTLKFNVHGSVHLNNILIYRVFHKELYNFESL
jgi:hypothetical protein